MSLAQRWHRGDIIVQEGWNPAGRGKLVEVRPAVVVEDSDRCLALYFPAGSTYSSGDTTPGKQRYQLSVEERTQVFLLPEPLEQREVVNEHWHVLSLMPPGREHAVWFVFDRAWTLSWVYVNLQSPFERTANGIRIFDYWLDLMLKPDMSWSWKDEDEFEEMCGHGALTAEQRLAVRAEGERLIGDIEARRWPFNGGWHAWRPDPAWPVPRIGDHWPTAR